MDTATLVKRIRTDLGMTQKQLGEKIGKTVSNISWWERGRSRPSGDVVLKLLELRTPQCWRLLRLNEDRFQCDDNL